MPKPHEDRGTRVENLVERAAEGDLLASEELFPIVYDELRRLARRKMAGERPGQTLQPTALVHEAYLRLLDHRGPQWQNRGHFFAAAAEAMRRILIDRARHYARLKHGGEQRRVDLDDIVELVPALEPSGDIEALLATDEVLSRLEEQDRELGALVKLRTFAGFSVPEAAEALNLSERTVHRRWTTARAWMKKELARPASAEHPS